MIALQPNTLLQGGKYKIEKKLGQGGFGITYLANQPALSRRVCIKEFFLKDYCHRSSETTLIENDVPSKRTEIEHLKTKFYKEAQLVASLDHPHIVKVFDVFYENGTAYYVMEYIEGNDLNQHVKTSGALVEQQALVYVKQIASALKYIHTRGINHLDVKPANIMIRSRSDDAVLIDFGLAKHYQNTDATTTLSPLGLSLGYAPIEQYSSSTEHVSPATDIYALGATFYKLLTGITPFEPTILLSQGLPSLPSHISAKTQAAIKAAMQIKSADRPQSIDSFLYLLNYDNEPKTKTNHWLILAVVIAIAAVAFCILVGKDGGSTDESGTNRRENNTQEYVERNNETVSNPENNVPYTPPEPQTVTKIVDCPKCGGNGTIVCPKCHGDCEFYDPSDDIERECDRCGGTGLSIYSSQIERFGGNATGHIECTNCGGSGKIKKTYTIN